MYLCLNITAWLCFDIYTKYRHICLICWTYEYVYIGFSERLHICFIEFNKHRCVHYFLRRWELKENYWSIQSVDCSFLLRHFNKSSVKVQLRMLLHTCHQSCKSGFLMTSYYSRKLKSSLSRKKDNPKIPIPLDYNDSNVLFWCERPNRWLSHSEALFILVGVKIIFLQYLL